MIEQNAIKALVNAEDLLRKGNSEAAMVSATLGVGWGLQSLEIVVKSIASAIDARTESINLLERAFKGPLQHSSECRCGHPIGEECNCIRADIANFLAGQGRRV